VRPLQAGAKAVEARDERRRQPAALLGLLDAARCDGLLARLGARGNRDRAKGYKTRSDRQLGGKVTRGSSFRSRSRTRAL